MAEKLTARTAITSVTNDAIIHVANDPSGTPDSRKMTLVNAKKGLLTTVTDPAMDAATSTAIIDANDGIVITTTTTANDQTLQTPTDTTTGKRFTVINDASSTDIILVDTQAIQIGDMMQFEWEGTAWVTNKEATNLTNLLGTGVLEGFTVSINADPTKFDVGAGTALVVDNSNPLRPKVTTVNFAGVTAVTPSGAGSATSATLSIDATGTIVEKNDAIPIGSDLRTSAEFGAINYPNMTTITLVDNFTNTMIFDVPLAISDLSIAIGAINESGNVFSANGANLMMDRSAGTSHSNGVNLFNDTSNPNRVDTAGGVGITWVYTWQDGVGGFNTSLGNTVITPGDFDDGTGGALTPNGSVANNRFSTSRLYHAPGTQLHTVQFGQETYSSIAEAEGAIQTEVFSQNPILDPIPFRGWLITKGNAADLSDITDAKFITAGKFGISGSSGATSSTTTMQQAYDNSVQPQVTTDATSGAVQIKRGSAADTDTTQEWLNGAGTVTANVDGNGMSVFTTLGVNTGTTTPSGRVNIIQDGAFNSEGTNGLRLFNTVTPDVALQMGVDNTNNIGFIQAMEPVVSFSSKDLALQGAGGDVVIGGTSALARLDVDNSVDSLSLRIDRATTTVTNSIAEFVSNVTSANTTHCKILADGDLENTNNSYGAISDIKLKENIIGCTPKLADLMQVAIKHFNFKNNPTNKQIGVIAQELELVFPGLVKETEDYETVPDPDWTPRQMQASQEVSVEEIQVVEVDGKYVLKKVMVQKTRTTI